ncbi:hypothetical protein CHCC20335_1456 [Bacillus paralicheniformis]|nr:hypothetical protein CHCC20335_1456 [Bacillus paralicheniformis]
MWKKPVPGAGGLSLNKTVICLSTPVSALEYDKTGHKKIG